MRPQQANIWVFYATADMISFGKMYQNDQIHLSSISFRLASETPCPGFDFRRIPCPACRHGVNPVPEKLCFCSTQKLYHMHKCYRMIKRIAAFAVNTQQTVCMMRKGSNSAPWDTIACKSGEWLAGKPGTPHHRRKILPIRTAKWIPSPQCFCWCVSHGVAAAQTSGRDWRSMVFLRARQLQQETLWNCQKHPRYTIDSKPFSITAKGSSESRTFASDSFSSSIQCSKHFKRYQDSFLWQSVPLCKDSKRRKGGIVAWNSTDGIVPLSASRIWSEFYRHLNPPTRTQPSS